MIRTLIIDDEPPARSRMKRLLESVPDCELVGEAGSSRKAMEMIPELEPELLLLDISMPGMDGMSLARTLQKMSDPPSVVFCTAWPDQALQAFDCDAVDYLVKPVRQDRLAAAVAKVSRLLGKDSDSDSEKQFLRSTVGGKTMLVAIEEVICLVAEDKYTTVFFDGGKTVINDTLVMLEQRFPDLLLRIHRNALVVTARIRGLQRISSGATLLALDGTDFQPEVSRRKLSMIRKYIRDSA